MSKRRRWGKAGVPLTPAEAAANDARAERARYRRALDNQRAYQLWRAGKVVPYRITVALDSLGLFGPEVDEACGVEEPAVDKWESGSLYPTWDQLRALAKLCGVTERFFMLTPGGDLPLRTSMRFHRVGGQRTDYLEPPPVRCFTLAAVEAQTRDAPPNGAR